MKAYDFYITPNEYEIAKDNGIDKKTVDNRVRSLGWDKKRAITTPIKRRKFFDKELIKKAAENGISEMTLKYRVKNGWSIEDAVTKKPINIKEQMKEFGKSKRKYPKALIKNAEKNGISIRTFYQRVQKYGMTPEQAANTPIISFYERGIRGKEAFLKIYRGC